MSQRFFIVSPEELKTDLVMLNANEAAHALRVLRLTPGRDIWLVDGLGRQARAVIERTNPMLCRVVERPPWPPPRPRLVLGLGISKSPAMDMIAQKMTELMVDEVRPFMGQHSVYEPGANKHERWSRITMQALKQCRCPRAPRYRPPDSLENLLRAVPPHALKILAWEEERALPLAAALPRELPDEIWALIGPEGGFSQHEVNLALEYGFVSCGLTRSILRAETAAIVVAAFVRCRWQQPW